MVKGINQFKAHFGDFNDRYVLIGGVACFLSLDEAGLDFRVTKDLDIDGIPTVPPEIIIPLKAMAWLDLTERRDAGEKVDDHDIKKHKNDIFRLFQVIDPGIRIALPEAIKNDMQRYGKPLKAKDRTGVGFPVYGFNGVVGYHKDYIVQGPGIIIGRKGSMGEVTWCDENFYPIDTTFYVSDLLNVSGLFFHYFLLKRYNFEKIGSDSAVPGLNRNAVYLIDFVVPSLDIINQFNVVAEGIFKKIKNNTEQIQTLSKTRDTLLPKLMNGEIRIGVDSRRGGSRTAPTRTAPTRTAPTIKPLGRLVGAFKTTSTKQINNMRNTPGEKLWQRNYWEHIIRNENEYRRIAEYIRNNPAKWEMDKLNNGAGNQVMEPQAIYNEEVWMV